MQFQLSEDLELLREAVRDFATKQIAPNVEKWDADHYLPYEEAIKPMGELGFFGTVIPEQYGGNEMGWLAAMIITEEIARVSSSLRVAGAGLRVHDLHVWERRGEGEVRRETGLRGIPRRFRHYRTECRFRRDVHEVPGRGHGRSLVAER